MGRGRRSLDCVILTTTVSEPYNILGLKYIDVCQVMKCNVCDAPCAVARGPGRDRVSVIEKEGKEHRTLPFERFRSLTMVCARGLGMGHCPGRF